MSCEDIKPGLIGLIYGEIEPHERQSVVEHLGSCAACRSEQERLTDTARLLSSTEGELPAAPALPISALPEFRKVSGSRWPDGRTKSWPFLYRLAAAAVIAIVVPLVVLAATNTRVEREQGRWAAQFALLPQRAARVDETTMRRMRQELEAEMASRFQKERQATIDSVNQRLEESRRALVQDLSVALARQEETLRAGYQSDRQEMRRRDRTVEQLVGNEMSRTRQWLGQVLNASQKPVIEQ